MSTNYEEMRNEIKRKQEELSNELRKIGENYFKETSKQYFKDFPFVEEFSWTQYTPYFMDGDECIFGVNADYPRMKFTGDEDSEEYYIPWKKPEEEYTDKDKAFRTLQTILGGVDDEVYKSMFGDHAKVTVNSNKIEVEFCEHD
ncbi:MAG: hypothetical protein ACHQ1D_01290 [Nitrososphaerales archaeon]